MHASADMGSTRVTTPILGHAGARKGGAGTPGASIRIQSHSVASIRIRVLSGALGRSQALSGAQAPHPHTGSWKKRIPEFLTRRGIPGNPGSADFDGLLLVIACMSLIFDWILMAFCLDLLVFP